jgi:hypothetical protein
MDQVISKNIGSVVTERLASSLLSWTAGSGSDNTTKTGIAFDRFTISGGVGNIPESMVATVAGQATLGSGDTLNVAITISDSADDSTFARYGSNFENPVVVATGPSGGGVVNFSHSMNVNLSSARRYPRVDYVPHLSATGTDTAVAIAMATIAGYDRMPSPT